MREQDFFEQPIEFKPTDIPLWCGNNMRPMDLVDCDRIIISKETIEFHRGKQCALIPLDEESFFIKHSLSKPLFYDKTARYFNPYTWSNITLEPVDLSNN